MTVAASGRRLTKKQYLASIITALGQTVSERAVAALPEDIRVHGFTNTADGQVTSFEHAEGYFNAAEAVAGEVDLAQLRAGFGCAAPGAECQREFVSELGLALFRRPLVDKDFELLLPLFGIAQAEGDDETSGAGLVLNAMLQSPKFLYQLEADVPAGVELRQLDSHEVASRLSYLIWGTGPDQTLLAGAAEGTLVEQSARLAEAERMLSQPGAVAASVQFGQDWLSLDILGGLTRDQERYPGFNEDLANAMAGEAQRLMEHVFWQPDAPMTQLLNSNVAFLTPELAELYGLESLGEGFQRYDLSNHPERRGLLTQPGVLAVSGASEIPSLVRRALFVLENVLCGQVSPPPADIVQDGEVRPGRGQREASEERLANPACGVCHGQFDPLAYAFETFDAIGARRTEDEQGNPLKENGSLISAAGEQPYANAVELAELLAQSPQAQACFTRKVAQYALGRKLAGADACWLAGVQANAPNATYRETVLAIVASDSFVTVRKEL